ncbi:MAG: sugar transferase, partial [Pygmaiobacter sp.]
MYAVLKRGIDIFMSLLGLILLSPLLLLLAVWIKCTSKGPVLFLQKRVGKDKTYFNILKFRSMYSDTPKDVPTHLLDNADSRITPVGHFLRKTSP